MEWRVNISGNILGNLQLQTYLLTADEHTYILIVQRSTYITDRICNDNVYRCSACSYVHY